MWELLGEGDSVGESLLDSDRERGALEETDFDIEEVIVLESERNLLSVGGRVIVTLVSSDREKVAVSVTFSLMDPDKTFVGEAV